MTVGQINKCVSASSIGIRWSQTLRTHKNIPVVYERSACPLPGRYNLTSFETSFVHKLTELISGIYEKINRWYNIMLKPVKFLKMEWNLNDKI